jgi:hypothetical protein
MNPDSEPKFSVPNVGSYDHQANIGGGDVKPVTPQSSELKEPVRQVRAGEINAEGQDFPEIDAYVDGALLELMEASDATKSIGTDMAENAAPMDDALAARQKAAQQNQLRDAA